MRQALVILIVGLFEPIAVQAKGTSEMNSEGQPILTTMFSEDAPLHLRSCRTPAPSLSEPPKLKTLRDGERSSDQIPFWGNDVLVYGGTPTTPSPVQAERVLSQDYSSDGRLYVAVSAGDSILVFVSSNGGVNWGRGDYSVHHEGYNLTSVRLLLAEGDSSFLFLFFRTSADNGDIYVARWSLSRGSSELFAVKADGDTIEYCSATVDLRNQYSLYLCFQQRSHGGTDWDVHTRISSDYGRTWLDNNGDVIMTRTPPTPEIAYGRSGRVYMAYCDRRQTPRPDTTVLRVKISSDYGATWAQSSNVGTPLVPVSSPQIGAAHGSASVWLVHMRDLSEFTGKGLGVFYYFSQDSGEHWYYGGEDGIGHYDSTDDQTMPRIACNHSDGSATVSYSVFPSGDVRSTWCSAFVDTGWAFPVVVNEHGATGNFSAAPGWRGTDGSPCVVYAGVGPRNVWFDARDLTSDCAEPDDRYETDRLRIVPNPVRDGAEVRYVMSRAGKTRLSLYDASGRIVWRLKQGNARAGWHSTYFRRGGLSAGVYVLQLSSDNFTIMRMLVME